MASHLKCPPSEPWILRISDYLRSKTDERRQVAESSSLISRIEKSGSWTTLKRTTPFKASRTTPKNLEMPSGLIKLQKSCHVGCWSCGLIRLHALWIVNTYIYINIIHNIGISESVSGVRGGFIINSQFLIPNFCHLFIFHLLNSIRICSMQCSLYCTFLRVRTSIHQTNNSCFIHLVSSNQGQKQERCFICFYHHIYSIVNCTFELFLLAQLLSDTSIQSIVKKFKNQICMYITC